MSKAVFLGRAMLNRFVANKAGVEPDVSLKILDALDEVVAAQLEAGASVRVFGGFLRYIPTKATRRRNPATGEPVDVPAGRKLVFKAKQPTYRSGKDE